MDTLAESEYATFLLVNAIAKEIKHEKVLKWMMTLAIGSKKKSPAARTHAAKAPRSNTPQPSPLKLVKPTEVHQRSERYRTRSTTRIYPQQEEDTPST